MLRLDPLKLERPDTVAEAVALLHERADARVIAGGTDLVPKLKRGQMRTGTLVSIDRITGLNRIDRVDGVVHIGARVPLDALARHPDVQPLTSLATAARLVATPTIRLRATIGGNMLQDTRCRYYDRGEFWREAIGHCLKLDGDTCRVAHGGDRCHATFCSDIAPALAVLGARATYASADEPEGRSIPVTELYRDDGIRAVAIGRSIVTEFTVPDDAPPSTYRKLRLRESFDFPEVGVAVSARALDDGTAVTVAVSGVSSALVVHHDTVVRSKTAMHVANAVFHLVRPMDTLYFPPGYRKKMTRRLVLESLHDLGLTPTD